MIEHVVSVVPFLVPIRLIHLSLYLSIRLCVSLSLMAVVPKYLNKAIRLQLSSIPSV